MTKPNALTINGTDYPTEEIMLKQSDLLFYPENPRVFSLLNISKGIPDQTLIENTMKAFDHVKQLKTAIKDNDGLIDPIIVRKNVVLEGNSRLAAYRLLAENDPIKWGYIKCQVLPDDFPDEAVFALLGQYHVSGKTNWSPFEQAGFLVRQIRISKRPVDHIAKVLGIKKSDANRLVRVYEFMEKHEDLEPRRWSYYDEYLKNQGIKKYRKAIPDIDDVIVEKVKSGEIREAIDIRNKLGEIAKSDSREAKQIMNDIIANNTTIYEGYEELEETGKIGDAYKVLQKFNERLNDKAFQKQLAKEDRGQIKYQLKQIKKQTKRLLERMN
ncbi:MAG: ParB N-terminal domain-containing protein [Coriobacteriales bacterium]|nr:ParB N-terminal domain-containing protein [Coriobacteriales bacterium]